MEAHAYILMKAEIKGRGRGVNVNEQLQNQEITADAKLVYAARQKAYLAEEKRHKKESIKALVYVVILHIVWTIVLIGANLIVKGVNGALTVILRGLLCSNILIITGCIFMPYIKKINEEVRK